MVKTTKTIVRRGRDGQWYYLSTNPFVDGQLVGDIMPHWVVGRHMTSKTTADRIAYFRLMAEESRRSPIGSEAEASEWDDRAWRLEHGMDEDDG